MNASTQRHVVVTGASRGIGLALVREFAERGDIVHAVCRATSDRSDLDRFAEDEADCVRVYSADVTSSVDVAALALAIGEVTQTVDVVVNNAGVMTDGDDLRTLDPGALLRDYETNAVGPALVTQALRELLTRAEAAIVVNTSSSFASIELKSEQMPQRYAYSMSKAALNMLTKTLAVELSSDGVIVVAIHPGWVQTGIGGPDAALTAEQSAADVVATIDTLTPETSGTFMTWNGRPLPW